MSGVGDIIGSLLEHVEDDGSLPALLCQDACRTLPIDHAGICVMDESGAIELVVGSDPVALRLEELQLTLGEGPCMDAFETSRVALYPDIAASGAERWPAYANTVHEHGVQAMFSFPLRIGGIRLGVLDLLSTEPVPLSESTLTSALRYVDAAVLILLHLHAGDPGADPALPDGPLEISFQDHAEIHQATGMIAVQARVGLAAALVLLRAHAFASDRALTEVARDVVERRLDFRSTDRAAGREDSDES